MCTPKVHSPGCSESSEVDNKDNNLSTLKELENIMLFKGLNSVKIGPRTNSQICSHWGKWPEGNALGFENVIAKRNCIHI